MGKHKNIDEFLKELSLKLKKELPKVLREIQIYEERRASGKLTKNLIQGAQFNQ